METTGQKKQSWALKRIQSLNAVYKAFVRSSTACAVYSHSGDDRDDSILSDYAETCRAFGTFWFLNSLL